MSTTPRVFRIMHNEIRKAKSPCYQCNKRHENCHSVCTEYAEYKQQINDIKTKVIETYITNRKIEDSDIRAKQRTIKKNMNKCHFKFF